MKFTGNTKNLLKDMSASVTKRIADIETHIRTNEEAIRTLKAELPELRRVLVEIERNLP